MATSKHPKPLRSRRLTEEEEITVFHRHWRELTTSRRAVFDLFAIKGKSHEEIAEAGYAASAEASRAALSRARDDLYALAVVHRELDRLLIARMFARLSVFDRERRQRDD